MVLPSVIVVPMTTSLQSEEHVDTVVEVRRAVVAAVLALLSWMAGLVFALKDSRPVFAGGWGGGGAAGRPGWGLPERLLPGRATAKTPIWGGGESLARVVSPQLPPPHSRKASEQVGVVA